MRPQHVSLGAAGYSAWLNINRMPSDGSFGVALGVRLSSGASLTYSVQHTLDPIYTPSIEWKASRTTTTGTITKIAHGLSVSDWVMMDAAAPFNTAYSVASVSDADTFTITVANSGATSVLQGASNIWTARVLNHSTLVNLTASADGNYAFPPQACRLIVTSWSSGVADLDVIQVG